MRSPDFSAAVMRWRVDLVDAAQDRGVVAAGRQGQRHPMARRLDLGDRPEPGRAQGVAVAGRGLDLGIGRDHVDPARGQVVRERQEALDGARLGPVTERRPGRVAGTRWRPRRGATGDAVPGRPPRRRPRGSAASSRPRHDAWPRLATGRRGHRAASTVRASQASSSSAVASRTLTPTPSNAAALASRSPSPCRRRAIQRRRADRGLVDGPPDRVEDEVPRPDVPDLAAPEARLEMGDAARREAPQVVARGALLARRADRLPLEEVVRPAVGAERGHPAVRLDDPRARCAPGTASRRARPRRSGRRAGGRDRPADRPPRCRGTPARSGSGTPARSAVSR